MSRTRLFIGVCITLTALAVGYTAWVGTRQSVSSSSAPGISGYLPSSNALLYIKSPAVGVPGSLMWQSLNGSIDSRGESGLTCDRSYFAAGKGLCITRNGSGSGYEAKLFDSSFMTLHTTPLPGTPSRARVSPDGKYGAVTMFVTGDSYTSANFSTRTLIVDMSTGKEVLELEKLKTTNNGKVLDAPDLNYWGVTFKPTNSNQFYATAGIGKSTYLIEADLSTKTARTIHDNVQCPSLSPDGTRIGYKHTDDDGTTHLFVLDLATGSETRLAEPTAIDDQVAWLNNDVVSYATVDAKLWSVPADGSGAPTLVASDAQSPAAIS